MAQSFDPLECRMTGYTRHGNHRIDVPYITKVAPNLWQGGVEFGLVLPPAISHLVSLYPEKRYRPHGSLATEMYVTMADSVEQDLSKVGELAEWVNARRLEGGVLVHCEAGLNRSSVVVAAALVLGDDLSGDEVIQMLRKKRSPAVLCNPAFEEAVRKFTPAGLSD